MPLLASILAAAGLAALPTPAEGPQLRFCPATAAWTYPLEPQRGVQSLLLQSVALVNPGPGPFELRGVEIQLLSDDVVKETRVLNAPDLAAIAAKAPGVVGLNAVLPGQYCGGALFGKLTPADSAIIQPGQALVLTQQVFALNGPRDRVRVLAYGLSAGAPAEFIGELPIRAGAARTALRFPLSGTWYVGASPSLHSHHRWAVFEEFAYDIAQMDARGLTHRGDGTAFADYYAYGAPVLAAADGVVVAALDGEPEDLNAMQRPGEPPDAYMKRLIQDQAARLAKGMPGIVGNYVVIDHGNGEFSLYAHLQPGSVAVKVGQKVKAGQPIAKLGSSGNSTEPHLHFGVCAGPDPLNCAAIPARFVGIDNAAPQTGDFVTAK
ncbi:murein DD-endopeptidase MepM/ murein hydrolase activator NlpD [Caulobacter ginsengisoli]|uniref:Murein DD-endopeptidase MepM/ murein hydrolase activator NlpD n=1 Tax=Caulobacter ginsengisoli TaxID=400775 RepID=A0ABU0IMD1_9CAUL|nr:M23 family metallopeptidase [Caulobacter ginsengisoli]MDQ0462541.1 murein DD-endopeptidase MepM/ murein hydrolase activator NlpD [Caulobacter ginsengisoli]